MAEKSAEQIPLDFAEAFADAVLVYEIWSPEYSERLTQIGPRFYLILEVWPSLYCASHKIIGSASRPNE